MSHAKQASKRKDRTKAVTVLGVAGALSLAGGVSKAAVGPSGDTLTDKTAITLDEEERARRPAYNLPRGRAVDRGKVAEAAEVAAEAPQPAQPAQAAGGRMVCRELATVSIDPTL